MWSRVYVSYFYVLGFLWKVLYVCRFETGNESVVSDIGRWLCDNGGQSWLQISSRNLLRVPVSCWKTVSSLYVFMTEQNVGKWSLIPAFSAPAETVWFSIRNKSVNCGFRMKVYAYMGPNNISTFIWYAYKQRRKLETCLWSWTNNNATIPTHK